MENVNYISGKTSDGQPIAMDGFRVESFAIYYDNAKGETLVDIYFKSGASETIYAFSDDGSNIPEELTDCIAAAKKNPELLTKQFPIEFIGCDTSDYIEFFFDGNTVEYYTRDRSDDKDLVVLHFVSGNVVEVIDDLDEKLYPGECVETLVDDCICRYMKDDDK